MIDVQSRRSFLRRAGAGVLGFWVGGTLLHLTPAEAREQRLPFQVLDVPQVRTLEAFADGLLPGSAAAGVAYFIDHQLAAAPVEQMLIIKYLGVEPPFASFYANGLAALDSSAVAAHETIFPEITDDQRQALIAEMAQADPTGWAGPPAPLFHFVLRSDALDVVYGTVQGVESLGIPYMAHIEPPSRWGE